MPLFNLPKKEIDKKYSHKVLPPQYLPSSVAPKLYELCDTRKYKELLTAINTSDIPEDVKDFLRIGATRHVVFNYAKIADYYAHADADVQRLMEKSALVIIDMNDAIANGYVRLSNNIEKIMKETGRIANEK